MTTVDYSKVKTSVWWDIENCEVPKGWDAHAVAQNVGSALLKMNYSGPVSILAYGDTNLIPHHVQQALSSTGVGLNHVPAGVKDASDKKILVDMLLWAVDNPAPANIMLISGDRDFSNALHQLSMRRYTILLAHPTHASAPLVAAAKNVWLWTSLASGGPPLTSGESSGPVNNPVSELAQSSKPTGSSSVAGDINVTSSDSFRAHLSDKRHTSQVAFVASHKAHASVSTKPVHESDVVEPVLCVVCQISCISKEAYANHIYGKRHRNNLELQSGKVENVSLEPVVFPKEVLTRQARRTRRRQMKKLIDSKKLQGKGVGEQSQPREQSMAEPQVQSQNTQEKTKCLEKQSEELREILLGTSESSVKELPRTKDHADTVNKQLLSGEARECFDGIVKPKEVLARQNRRIRIRPRKVLIDSKKLQEKTVEEKSQPREESMADPQFQSQDSQEKHVASVNQSEALPVETIAEPQLPSHKTQENTKCFEKQSEELRKILLGTSEISVKEKLPRTKDRETVNKQLLNEEAIECFDGIVKPVNESQGAIDPSVEMKTKQKEVMERRAVGVISKLCHLCVVICDSQGVSTVVCDRLHHWPNQKAFFAASDHVVWCRVCQISCKKAAYGNHTNGEKHRQKLELQSAKNENMSKGQAKLSEENAEKMKKVLCKDQTAFDSLKHADMVKEQPDKAFVNPRKSRDESDQGAQEDKEDVKEVNAVSENLVHAFNGLNRESRIPKESRGCLDVIPERVQVPTDVHVTGKFEDESNNKTEKECGGGGKEHPGEAGKREESKKVQVDNLWTRLWWGKS